MKSSAEDVLAVKRLAAKIMTLFEKVGAEPAIAMCALGMARAAVIVTSNFVCSQEERNDFELLVEKECEFLREALKEGAH